MLRQTSSKPSQIKTQRQKSLKKLVKSTSNLSKSRKHCQQPSHRTITTTSIFPSITTPCSVFTISTQNFSQTDRSGLKPLPSTPRTISQLESFRQHTAASSQSDLQSRAQQITQEHESKKSQQTKTSTGNTRVSDMLNNSQSDASLKEINQAANVTPPPTHLSRHLHSPYFIPMWDPELSQSKELIQSFENSTGLKFEYMDLIGQSLDLSQSINLRHRLIQKNKVSLVQVVSTQGPFEFANVTAEIWANHFANHGESNQDGAVIVQPTIVNITEGIIQGLFRKSIAYKTSQQLSPMLQENTISFHIKQSDDATARARRFLDCRNRFVDNIFLVDERGLIRWRAGLATIPDSKFMQTLFNVTNDLILETKYDEAD